MYADGRFGVISPDAKTTNTMHIPCARASHIHEGRSLHFSRNIHDMRFFAIHSMIRNMKRRKRLNLGPREKGNMILRNMAGERTPNKSDFRPGRRTDVY